jgi:hypothetical protein
LAFAALVLAAPPSQAENHINFSLGQKMLEKDDWSPVEDQPEFGVASTFGSKDWPVQIAIDFLASAKEDEVVDNSIAPGFIVDLEGRTSELAFGVRKIWNKNSIRPFVGGGVGIIAGAAEAVGIDDDDSDIGVWAHGGVFWRLGKRFNIGVDLRVSRAEVSIFGVDVQAGGEHLGLILGFGFGE